MDICTFGIFCSGDEVRFGERGDGFVHSAARAKVRELNYQCGRDDFVVFAADFDLDGGGPI